MKKRLNTSGTSLWNTTPTPTKGCNTNLSHWEVSGSDCIYAIRASTRLRFRLMSAAATVNGMMARKRYAAVLA